MAKPALGPIYRVGEVEIDPAKALIRRDGEEFYLRSKTLQVLRYLIEHRDRSVTREDLLEEIWTGVAVTDDAVTQCIADLRKALGDDARAPRYLKTIPKVGFRFIHDVEEVSPAGGELELISRQTMEIETADAMEVEVRQELIPARRPPRLGWIVLGVVALAAGAWWFIARPRLDPVIPSISGKIPVAVMFFEDRAAGQASASDSSWLREGLADMLITDLSRSPKLAVLGREHLRTLLARTGRNPVQRIDLPVAFDIAQRGHAKIAILGAYTMLGSSLRLDVQVYETDRGRLIGGESLVLDQLSDLLVKFGALSTRVAVDLKAPIPRSGQSGVVAEAHTANLEAFRAYSLGVERAENYHVAEALELFRKAVALDPNFAMAHARIGYTYVRVISKPADARPYLERAFALTPQLSSRDRMFIAAWNGQAHEDYQAAIRAYRQILDEYPVEVSAYADLARVLSGEHRHAEARDVLLRGLTIDPDWGDLHNILSGVYFELGDTGRSIAAARRFVELTPGEPNAYDSLGLVLHRAGRYPEAIAEFQRALNLNPQFDVAVIHLGNTLVQTGQYREAIQQFRRFIDLSETHKSRGHGAIAWVLWRKRDYAGALRELGGFQDVRLLKAAIEADVSAEKGAKQGPQQVASPVPAGQEEWNAGGARLTQRVFLYLEGYVELRHGNADAAINRMKEALGQLAPFWSQDELEDCLADTYLELGRFAEAAVEYSRVLRMNSNRARARYHLGVTYDRLGRTVDAQAEWKRFRETWKAADPDLPELIDVERKVESAKGR